VGFHDGSADRKPHAHAMLFCREEWIKDPVWELDTLAAITDFDLDDIPCSANTHSENSGARGSVHCIHAVTDKIDENLLELDAIQSDKWKRAFDRNVHTNATPRGLFGHEVVRFGYDAG
jgi:hypothetical protein